ncbi:cytochrome C biogenesis protein CcmC [Thermodesulfomicrobium sp. WS]|uniref:cytochrome c biogenesis protein CcsA n=1 Tax=Thermodesulfomicrobium sp. WS TaxID=3004129 RepID=UPI002490D266|nr:cytochrome c biogenesis protein CcsA [Thermodesulfomicrobium sp. WS]BDV00983.1 cytochrome C biogenesis protein CcmC [Thermodesulfomicrobium sp. WS]
MGRWNLVAAVAGGVGLAVAQWAVWVYAPLEAVMGVVQKIFYLHVPLAWWAFVCFFGVFAASIGVLWKKRAWCHVLAGVLAEVGVLLAGLALVTGALWGRAAWNTWWTWDPRLTTTLVLWFVYAGYLALRASDLGSRGPVICAVLGIVAFVDVPLVFVSARLWRSIHPVVLAQGGGMEPEMWVALVVHGLAFGLLVAALVLARFRLAMVAARVSRIARARLERREA